MTATANSIDPDSTEQLKATDEVESPVTKKDGGGQPDTGYRSYLMLFVSIMFLSFVTAAVAVKKIKRKQAE